MVLIALPLVGRSPSARDGSSNDSEAGAGLANAAASSPMAPAFRARPRDHARARTPECPPSPTPGETCLPRRYPCRTESNRPSASARTGPGQVSCRGARSRSDRLDGSPRQGLGPWRVLQRRMWRGSDIGSTASGSRRGHRACPLTRSRLSQGLCGQSDSASARAWRWDDEDHSLLSARDAADRSVPGGARPPAVRQQARSPRRAHRLQERSRDPGRR